MNKKVKHFIFNPLLIILFVTAMSITAAAIFFEQPAIRVLPLYVSLVIAFLQSRINRFAHLIGGINSILYAWIYFIYKLYGLSAYAILLSFPIQIITFIKWNKNSYGESTVLKKMNKNQKIITVICFAVCWAALTVGLSLTDSSQAILDSTVSLLGVLITILTFLSFAEYTKLYVLSAAANMLLHISMVVQGDFEQVAFLIYDVFCVICMIRSVYSAKMLLEKQAAA